MNNRALYQKEKVYIFIKQKYNQPSLKLTIKNQFSMKGNKKQSGEKKSDLKLIKG